MKKYLLIICLFFPNFIHAEIVEKLLINGNKKISYETIKVYGDIKLNTNYTKADLDQILKKLYETNFFEDVSISFDNKTLSILVKEYPTIYTIKIEGEKTKKISFIKFF